MNKSTGEIQHEFSPKAMSLLLSSGWYKNRNVDIREYVDELETYGYVVSESAKQFLSSFGGIEITYDVQTRFGPIQRYTHFNPLKALIYPEEIETCVHNIKSPLCIIGETGNEHITLVITYDGKVYGCCEETLFSYGTIEQAIEEILSDDHLLSK